MKYVIAFWAGAIAIVSGILLWRNNKRYPSCSILFRITKTLIELGMVLVSAWRLPALLSAWISYWLTKPIENAKIRMIVGVLVGVLIGWASMFCMEIVVLLSLFSLDEITGDRDGFLKDWKVAKWKDLERNNHYQAA